MAVRGACREYTSFLFDEDHLGWATRATSEMSNLLALLWSLDACALPCAPRLLQAGRSSSAEAFQCCIIIAVSYRKRDQKQRGVP